MKAQILKIAGVKSEKEFYKKYKTEADFMKVHGKEFKKAQQGINMNTQGDTNKNGIPDYLEYTPTPGPNQFIQGNNTIGSFATGNVPPQYSGSMFKPTQIPEVNYGMPGQNKFGKPSQDWETPGAIPAGLPKAQPYDYMQANNQAITGQPKTTGTSSDALGGISNQTIASSISSIPEIFNAFAAQKKQKQSLEQQNKLLGLFETLSQSTDVNAPYQKNILDSPENYAQSTNMFYPSQGTGYDILRGVGRDGATIRKAQSGENIENRPGSIMGREPMIPEVGVEMPIQEKPSNFDSKSARDNWVQKTGLPWSEAKRLGYTSGSAKDNTKLLSELNDPRFKKENLRNTPPKNNSQSRIPVQHRETPTGKLTPIKKPIQSYEDFFKGKSKYKGNNATLSTNKKTQTQREEEVKRSQAKYDDYLLGERPLYYMANPSKAFGDFKSMLNPSGTREDETSESFRKEVMANRYNPTLSNKQRLINNTKMGLKQVPKAAANLATVLSATPYTTLEQMPIGIGEAAAQNMGSRAAGYVGQGATRIGTGAAKQLGTGFVPNFVMYKDGGYIPTAQDGINNFGPDYDLYSDGGYEPLNDSNNDSNNIKQYANGGVTGNPIYGAASGVIGNEFNNSAGYQAGAAAAPYADMILPGSGLALQMLGGGLDQAFGDAGKIKKLTRQNTGIEDRIKKNSMWRNPQYSANMQEGGYMNPEYNPQLITMFGDHDSEDFADYAHKYRSGGHLKDNEYTPVSNRGLEIYAEGGEVTSYNLGETQVESGGYLKPISFNPHNAGTGWTSEIQGQYHHDYDSKLGHSGVIFNHGGNQVEAEKGELLRQVQEGDSIEGGQSELSANITGNLELQPIFDDADPKYKPYYGMKIKNAHKVIADKDKKLNLKQIKIDNEIAQLNPKDKLKQSSLTMMKKGIDEQYKTNAEAADYITNHQTKVNDLVDQLSKLNGVEYSHEKFAKKGILSDVLAKGEISQAARNGKTIKAQAGTYSTKGTLPGSIDYNIPDVAGDIFKGSNYETQWGTKRDKAFSDPTIAKQLITDIENYSGQDAEDVKTTLAKEKTMSGKIAKAYELASDKKVGPYHTILNSIIDKNTKPEAAITSVPTSTTNTTDDTTELEPIEETKKGFPWLGAATSLIRGMQPAFNMPLGNQNNPELYALANNRVKGFAVNKTYDMLKTPAKYSADKDRNAVLSQAREAVKNSGNNPAAQSAIMASVADAMNQIGSKEQEINQQGYQGVYNDNIATVNQNRNRNAALDMDAQLKMLQAESNTDARTLSALTSLYGKEAANKRENIEYNVGMAEHPDFTFGPDGRIIKLPRYIDFDTSGKGVASGSKNKGLASGKGFSYDDSGNIIGVHSLGKENNARDGKTIKKKNINGNIVKAFKNL